MIRFSSDPDVPSVVYCDEGGSCTNWEFLSAGQLPEDYLSLLEHSPGGTAVVKSFCSWECLQRKAAAEVLARGGNPSAG